MKYFHITKFCLSEKNAKKQVKSILEKYFNVEPGEYKKFRLRFANKNEGNLKEFNFKNLVTITRIYGFPMPLSNVLERNDEIFQVIPNHKTEYSGDEYIVTFIDVVSKRPKVQSFKRKTDIRIDDTIDSKIINLSVPYRLFSIEDDLTTDILYYRKKITEDESFEMICRHFRNYLIACICLIESFLTRHQLLMEKMYSDYESLEEYKQQNRLVDKLCCMYVITSKNRDLTALKFKAEWVHFQEIRRMRNNIVHSNDPYFAYEMVKVAKHLNYVNKGVGGLLHLFRSNQGVQTLPFIERLRNAPNVMYIGPKNL